MDVYEALIDLSQQHKLSLTEEHRIECYKTIEKVIKAVKIIKNKHLITFQSDPYAKYIGIAKPPITKEEEQLLKEVFYD